MLIYSLIRGVPLRAGKGGRAVRLLNSSLIHYWLSADWLSAPNSFSAATILIGYDRLPTQVAFDAILPPDCEVSLNIPAAVQTIFLFWEASGGSSTTRQDANPVLIEAEWLDCAVQGGLRAVPMPVPLAPGGTKYVHGRDAAGGVWPIAAVGHLLDQAQGFGLSNHTRPKIVPSITDTIRAVTVANTIFTFQGPNAFLANVSGFRVVHRIYVSVSAACLIVIGMNALTVGSPGAEEVYRGLLQAGVPFPIEFGEGLEVLAMGTAGAWKAYTSVAVTLDATVIGG